MTTRTLGERIGVEQVTLGVDQLPLHDHFVVPEPSTWLLASSAVLVLGLRLGWWSVFQLRRQPVGIGRGRGQDLGR